MCGPGIEPISLSRCARCPRRSGSLAAICVIASASSSWPFRCAPRGSRKLVRPTAKPMKPSTGAATRSHSWTWAASDPRPSTMEPTRSRPGAAADGRRDALGVFAAVHALDLPDVGFDAEVLDQVDGADHVPRPEVAVVSGASFPVRLGGGRDQELEHEQAALRAVEVVRDQLEPGELRRGVGSGGRRGGDGPAPSRCRAGGSECGSPSSPRIRSRRPGWPLFSMQTARGIPRAAASARIWLPNCASTRMPTCSFGTPPSIASQQAAIDQALGGGDGGEPVVRGRDLGGAAEAEVGLRETAPVVEGLDEERLVVADDGGFVHGCVTGLSGRKVYGPRPGSAASGPSARMRPMRAAAVRERRRRTPVSKLEFVGCVPVRVSAAEIEGGEWEGPKLE